MAILASPRTAYQLKQRGRSAKKKKTSQAAKFSNSNVWWTNHIASHGFMVMDLSTFQAGSQSTTSHLFAPTRLFHRLTFIRPALMLKSRQVVWEGVAHITTISLGFWEWRCPKRGDAHITVTVTYKQVVYNETGHCKNLFLKSKYLLWLLHQIRSLQKADKLYSYSQFREHKRILKCYRFVQLTLFQFCLNITK